MVRDGEMRRGVGAAGLLLAFCLLVGLPGRLYGGEKSYRAVANGVGLHVAAVHVIPPVGPDQWRVSGFAPGLGSFSQSVPSTAINVDYADGTASVNAAVTTSLGLPVVINLSWTNPGSQVTQYVNVPNPSRGLSIYYKRTSVSGTIGSLSIGSGGLAATSSVSYRVVSP